MLNGTLARVARVVGIAAVASVLSAPRARAQATPAGQAVAITSAPRDSLRPPLTPFRAMITSALVPGLAQSRLNRSIGFLFASVEMGAWAMYMRSRSELATARAFARDSTPLSYQVDPATGLPVIDPKTDLPRVTQWSTAGYDSERVRARKTQVEDWMAVIVFNHLFAAVDAFVAAQLWDLPARVELRAAPGARTGYRVAAQVRW